MSELKAIDSCTMTFYKGFVLISHKGKEHKYTRNAGFKSCLFMIQIFATKHCFINEFKKG